ncbi:hypothetical protein ACH37Y_06235 [Sphingomonas paucimobilis]|uniref:hypothetical protein n=1 Tax=Sphingomonas paucimobilis TaxID=13689 RepID=UPI0037B68DFF
MDDAFETKAELLMLRHVTEAMWANFLANSGGDTIATTKRVAEESLQSVEGMYARTDNPSENLHAIIQRLLHHEESFWKSVLFQVEVRAGVRPPYVPGSPE